MFYDFFNPEFSKNFVEGSSSSLLRWANNKSKNEEIVKEGFSNSRIHACKYCSRQFTSIHALHGHQNAHRKERMQIKQEKLPDLRIHVCKYCGRQFASGNALGGHQNAHRKERRQEKMRLDLIKEEKLSNSITFAWENIFSSAQAQVIKQYYNTHEPALAKIQSDIGTSDDPIDLTLRL